MPKSDKKAEQIRFLKKIVLFCFAYIIIFTIAMTVIFCVNGNYPETLVTVTFVYFGLEAVVSAGIKIFEKKTKSTYDYGNFIPPDDVDRNEENYK